jgi:hypothetical protein
MSAGAGLREGCYKEGHLSEDEMWSAFAYLFSPKSAKAASYKYGFLKAILDNLYNTDNNLTLTFDQLFSKFAEIYWNLVLKHHIRQSPVTIDGKATKLERALWETKEKFNLPDEIPFESLSPEATEFVCRKVKIGCKENVVGALYGDLQELFYSFSKTGEFIKLNPQMYEFACKHKVAIEKMNYYEWARYLEKVNTDDVMDHLLTKIDESAKRSNLDYYRNILFEEFENRCFYCGKPLTKASVHVDHFIPWSFIKDDNLWNFVLACPSCNLKKNDKLAPKTKLDLLIKRNEVIIEHDNHNLMKNYQANRLVAIYSWASDNGYKDIWVPPHSKEAING